MDDLLIVKGASAFKLVVLPVTIIGYFIVGVVKNSLSAHFVLPPLTYVLSALVVVKHSSAVAHVVELCALVPTSQVGLCDVLEVALLADSALLAGGVPGSFEVSGLHFGLDGSTGLVGVVDHGIGSLGVVEDRGNPAFFFFFVFVLLEAHFFKVHNALYSLLSPLSLLSLLSVFLLRVATKVNNFLLAIPSHLLAFTPDVKSCPHILVSGFW